MVKRSVVVRPRDILKAMDEADEFLDQKDFAAFQASTVVQRAVERCVEIVSEASRHIPEAMTDQYPDVPWSAIKAVGNVLRHEYQRVEALVIWRTATRSFRELRPIILEMIQKAEE